MTTIESKGATYFVTRKLDTFAQLHIARKLGPAMPIVEGLLSPENAAKKKALLVVLMLSHIPDADAEFVIKKALSVVTRAQGQSRAAVLASDGTLMFDDMGMETMLDLTTAVIEDSLGEFFRTALADLNKVDPVVNAT